MAIGSTPEIGMEFGRWGDMTPEQQRRQHAYMRKYWGENLLAGYATLHYAPRGEDNPHTQPHEGEE